MYKEVLFEAIPYIVYTTHRYCLSIVCTSIKALASFEVKIEVQNMALSFREWGPLYVYPFLSTKKTMYRGTKMKVTHARDICV